MAADSFLTRLYRRFARTIHTRQLTADAFPLHVWHLSLGLPGEITGNEILSLSAARPPETCYVSIRERVRAGGLDASCMVSESVFVGRATASPGTSVQPEYRRHTNTYWLGSTGHGVQGATLVSRLHP